MRSMHKPTLKQVALGVATSVLAAGGLGLALPTSAFAAAADCSAGKACIWQDGEFNSSSRWAAQDISSFSSGICINVLPDWNDKISSASNRTNRNIIFYADADCKGASLVFAPNTQLGNFGTFNDKTSSVKV